MARSVRHKLLAMALLPLALVFPLLVLVMLGWSHLAYDRLLITKVRADLAVAQGYFLQVKGEVGSGTRAVAESHRLFRAWQALRAAPGGANPTPAATLEALLEEERQRLGLDLLRLQAPGQATPPRVDHTAPELESPSAQARLVVLPAQALAEWAPALSERLGIALVPTRNAAPSTRAVEDRAMLLWATQALQDEHGDTVALLHGAVLLNQNLGFIDTINRIVYPEGALPFGSQGTATLFLDDVRITTNVRLFQDERAIGTRVSAAVRDAVLKRGQTWLDRAFVVNDWYVSAYQPLVDARDERVGMLYVGYLERPFRWVRYAMLLAMGLIFLAVMSLAAWFSVRWARSIFAPLEQMDRTMQRVENGDSGARVGQVRAQDELGALANHLDHLLDGMEDKTRRLQEWAAALDHKVAERTRDLELSHAQLRQTQQQLVKSEKLAAIGQLTASIAHEINNPIAVMQGNLDLMRELLGPHGDAATAEWQLLDQQVERMRLIVTQLLQYARPTEFAGYVNQLDVNQVVRDSLVLVAHSLQQRHIEVEQDLQASIRVACNRQELQQVVINLMINAIQAMPDGGRMTLRTLDEGDAGHLGSGAVIEVCDQGPGLAPGVKAQLFTPFFTTKNDGNGLGLWISLGLVERYGGRLEACNLPPRPGQQSPGGACFRVCLLAEAVSPSGQIPALPPT